ncbi:MAG TPA: hypothetical protein VFG63_08960 [Nocardioidaceae bacterium]|nr:hypothetical protein [Nocardioidaceae bacterium]
MSESNGRESEVFEQDEAADPAADPAPDHVEQDSDFGPGTAARAYELTGNPTVDSVLESLERLERTPVSEHVEIFESAHEKLRGALADAGDDQAT